MMCGAQLSTWLLNHINWIHPRHGVFRSRFQGHRKGSNGSLSQLGRWQSPKIWRQGMGGQWQMGMWFQRAFFPGPHVCWDIGPITTYNYDDYGEIYPLSSLELSLSDGNFRSGLWGLAMGSHGPFSSMIYLLNIRGNMTIFNRKVWAY